MWQRENSPTRSRVTPARGMPGPARTADRSRRGASTPRSGSGTSPHERSDLSIEWHAPGHRVRRVSSDGRGLASAGLDNRHRARFISGTPRLGRDLNVLRGHASFVRRLAFLPDEGRLASLGDDGLLEDLGPLVGRGDLVAPGPHATASGWRSAPDGSRIATSGAEGTVRTWDATQLRRIEIGRIIPPSRES